MKHLRSIAGACGIAAAVFLPSLRAAEVATESYGGWTNCLVLRGGDCKAVLVPAVGARILHYSINGENILFENPEVWGDTLLT